MSTEEKQLIEQFGKQTPFRVPEGFFASFEQSLMQNLPDQQASVVEMPRSRSKAARRWSYAAAACVAVAIMGTAYVQFSASNDQKSLAASAVSAQATTDYTIDQMADYAMMDNTEMYALMMGE